MCARALVHALNDAKTHAQQGCAMQFSGITLRTFAFIVFAHPYCARNSCRNVTPRNAMSARAEKTFQTNIGLVAVAITSLAVYSLEWSVTPNFFLIASFVLRFSTYCKKMNKKSMWEVYKFLIFFAHAA